MMRRIFWPKPENEQDDWLIKEDKECSIASVIQMNGIHLVIPNVETQPDFKEALISAAKAGVQIVCYGCSVEADSIKITSVAENTAMFAG